MLNKNNFILEIEVKVLELSHVSLEGGNVAKFDRTLSANLENITFIISYLG